RRTASPPGAHVRADVRMEKARRCGDTATTSAASNIATAETTARRRSRSTSTRRDETPTTRAGRIARPTSHRRGSFIAIAVSVHGGSRLCRDDRIAQPPIETRQLLRNLCKGLDDDTIEDVVEKPPFDRDQIEATANGF